MFTPSGCLTGDTLSMYVAGSLSVTDVEKVQQHIAECPLCADAADGLRIWLTENQTKQSELSTTEEISGEKAVKNNHSINSPSSVAYKFHIRTEKINERLKQRIHFHKQVDEANHKRRAIKPYAWIGVAATVVLFLSIFYIFRIQNISDNLELANQKDAFDSLRQEMPDSSKQFPETEISLAQNEKIAPDSRKKQITSTENVDAEAYEVTGVLSIVEDNDIQEVSVAEESPAAAPVVAKSETAQKQAVQNEDSMLSINQEESTKVEGVVVTALGISRDKKSPGYKEKEAKKATSGDQKSTEICSMEDVETEEAQIFVMVEQMPEFPGGMAKLQAFLAENITFPESAKESGIQGTVYVSFVVRKDGRISDAKILRGIGGGCEEEALRVVNKMPRWKPGTQRGKNVDVQFNLPIVFKLD